MTDVVATNETVLVVGGGISGVTACMSNERRDLSGPNKQNLFKTKFNMPVMYYSQLMTVAYGGSAKEAGLDGHVIRAKQLEEIAAKPVKK